jgi:hypothetical protein
MYEFMKIEAGWLLFYGPKPSLEQRGQAHRKELAVEADENAYAGRSRASERFVIVGEVAF